MFDVVALGELLIDFTPAGTSETGNILFERNPGGAPANVLAAVTKLGGTGALIGKVGCDPFGFFLRDVLDKHGIDGHGLRFSHNVPTTLAFVQLNEHGDRSFSFYRKPGADTTLAPEDLDFGLIDSAKVFHFGSLSMTDEPARSATRTALEYAREKGKIITYDPNWRPALWMNDEQAKENMLFGLQYADVLKVSEEELAFLTGKDDVDAGSRQFLECGVKIVVVTLGPKGCYYRCAKGSGSLSTYDTKVTDTTGAGDCFFGAMICQLSRYEGALAAILPEELAKMADFANAAGALCATKKGTLSAMPTEEDIRRCMSDTPLLKPV
ncbi:PfkB family carbohydrate kinase [Caproicibacter fermentans]|uniref:Carbohydrate kinase n=1 Tax=Caproicibacter fermentans TaxID=2576756 RepID=A0A7G8TFC3_9FIRM|nr:PfkB family carbohydrate kinase [Caproicibacter fermentans]QNK42314.1 carbohydrate kinase [Caproicibacter fermentans]